MSVFERRLPPSVEIDGVEVVIERLENGSVTLHGYLTLHGDRLFTLNPGTVRATGDSYRIGFPHTLKLVSARRVF